MKMDDIIEALLKELQPLRFGPPVTHVYNPLQYAQKPYKAYLRLYGKRPKEVVLLGMNPGPWGMAQTGDGTDRHSFRGGIPGEEMASHRSPRRFASINTPKTPGPWF